MAPAIAHAVELDPEAELVPQLRDRRLLLVLDNFEQVLDAAPVVGALLAGAPGVRVLATSRTRLDLYGEHEFAVDPLEHDEGVELFCARARARDRRFTATPAVADVVARLECLPLAIELVASRADRMSAEEMAAGLPILELATGGPRDAPDRHRALRAAIDWSLELLDEPERQRFAALGVFAGGLDAAAAAAVLDATPADLDRLAGQSLLRRLPERWTMLEALRERALELLTGLRTGAGAARRPLPRARRAIRAGAQGPRPGGLGRAGGARARQPARRAGPRRAACRRCGSRPRWASSGTRTATAPRASATSNARSPRPATAPPLLRGRALQALGILRSQRGDERAEATFRDGLAMFRAAGDRTRVRRRAQLAGGHGPRSRRRRPARAPRSRRRPTLYRSLDDRHRLADSLSNLAVVALDQEQLEEAATLFAESIALDRDVRQPLGRRAEPQRPGRARARPRRARRGGRAARRGGRDAAPARRSAVAGDRARAAGRHGGGARRPRRSRPGCGARRRRSATPPASRAGSPRPRRSTGTSTPRARPSAPSASRRPRPTAPRSTSRPRSPRRSASALPDDRVPDELVAPEEVDPRVGLEAVARVVGAASRSRIASVPVRSLLTKNTAPPPSRAWLRVIVVPASSTRERVAVGVDRAARARRPACRPRAGLAPRPIARLSREAAVVDRPRDADAAQRARRCCTRRG